MDIQKAIKELKTVYFPMHSHDEAVNMAIAALQEQAERGKGCEGCAGPYGKMKADFGFNFCPRCGRRLK